MRLGEIGDNHFIDALFMTVCSMWSRATRARIFFCGKGLGVRGGLLAGESPTATWFDKLSKHRSSWLEIMFQAQHGSSDAARLWSAEADYANPAAAGRRGDGDDGVVKVHGEIVAGAAGSRSLNFA